MNCPKCSIPVQPDEDYCGNCGQPLKAGASQGPTVYAGPPRPWAPPGLGSPTPDGMSGTTPSPPYSNGTLPAAPPPPYRPAYPAPAQPKRTLLWIGTGMLVTVLVLGGIAATILYLQPRNTGGTNGPPTSFNDIRASGSVIFHADLTQQSTPIKVCVGDFARGGYFFTAGRYVVSTHGNNLVTCTFEPKEIPQNDYAVEVEANAIAGANAGADTIPFLVLRNNTGYGYYYYFAPKARSYKLRLFSQQQPNGLDLVNWTRTDSIQPTGINRIAFQVKGSQITLYMNDTLLKTVNDTTFSQGTPGFGLSGTNAAVVLSRLTVYKID